MQILTKTPVRPACRYVILFLVSAILLGAQDPFPAGAKAVNHGDVSAREGPVWHPTGTLYFSGGNRISQRDSDGKVSVFRDPAGSNGLLIDRQGRMVTCESRKGRITRTELDGSITALTDGYEGKRFNSPNDLTIDSRGRIYFTDPRYGARDDMEIMDSSGHPVEGVYRIDGPGQVFRVITHEVDRPNGVLVSPNDEFLYVADNNNNVVGGARKLWRFKLRPDGSVDLQSRTLIFDWKDGRGPDGLEMDQAGRLYVAGGLNHANPPFETAEEFKGGVYVLSAGGELIEFVGIPVDEVTNVAFGGDDWKTLFITAGGTLWSIPVTSPGWVPYPGR